MIQNGYSHFTYLCPAGRPAAVHHCWHEDVRKGTRLNARESFASDADDGVQIVAASAALFAGLDEMEAAPNDLRIPSESSRPIIVGEHGVWVPAGFEVVGFR